MRKPLAVALALAVQAAALSAPLVHAHPDEHATPHHAGPAVHTHWAGHAHAHHVPDVATLGAADDDRAVYFTVFVAVAVSALPAPAVTPGVVELPVPAERPAYRLFDIVRSHDPPVAGSLSSRAPPAFLS